MAKINFGTDGWRAVMAEDFTFGNVGIVAQALAFYLQEAGLSSKGLVVGYDNRFFSDRFAQKVCSVMAANNIETYLPDRAMPTPVTAFAVKLLETSGAVMITASHNPPEYNGIKFIPDYAGPATPEITKKIEEQIARVFEGAQVQEIDFEEARAKGMVHPVDPLGEYLNILKELVDFEAIKRAGLKVVIDPLYGAGVGYLEQALKESGCVVGVLHNFRDPLFGGGMPEPSERFLGPLKEEMRKTQANLGLSLDGDADRFGIVDADGTYITPNQVLYVLYEHYLTRRGVSGPVARTVATTSMLDRIAKAHGLAVDETPVGFKYIGQSLIRGCLLGGEESGGLSVRGHIPEKDGILACLLMAEVVAVNGRSLTELIEAINEKYGRLITNRLDIKTSQAVKERVLGVLPTLEPGELAGLQVVETSSVDGKKFVLSDGSWVLIRASGTEPLFRIYGEGASMEQVIRLQKALAALLGLPT